MPGRAVLADKPRGYAFIEYEHKKDMKEAYKQSDGRKIEGRRILVDVERGRTVEHWWVALGGCGWLGSIKERLKARTSGARHLQPSAGAVERQDARATPCASVAAAHGSC
jgi:U1 small nuclear ribonucleoprotein